MLQQAINNRKISATTFDFTYSRDYEFYDCSQIIGAQESTGFRILNKRAESITSVFLFTDISFHFSTYFTRILDTRLFAPNVVGQDGRRNGGLNEARGQSISKIHVKFYFLSVSLSRGALQLPRNSASFARFTPRCAAKERNV